MLSSLSKIANPAQTSQFTLVKDPKSNRINDFSMNKATPVTLYDKLITFRDTNKIF